MADENGFWIDAPEVVRLFPTFVWKCQLWPEVYRAINAAILNRLHEMRRGLPSLDRGELRKVTQLSVLTAHQILRLEIDRDSIPYHIDHYRVMRTTYCRLLTPNTGTSSFGLARFAPKDGADFARSSTQLRALAYPQVTAPRRLRSAIWP